MHQLLTDLVILQAEGEETSYSTSVYIEIPPNFSQDMTVSFPDDLVEGSERVEFTVVGELSYEVYRGNVYINI